MRLLTQEKNTEERVAGHPLEVAEQLRQLFYVTAAERDVKGGTPLEQRDAIRKSGLLKLSIPLEFGGLGADWSDIYSVIRTIARADSSLAQVLGFQYLMLSSVRLYGQEAQWKSLFTEAAQNNLWWGNALNPLDNRTIATATEKGYVLNGHKSFCSGATDSERLLISAIEEGTNRFLVAWVPTTRAGIYLKDDWDNMGQRQTDSGSAEFINLHIETGELLINPGPLSSPFSNLRSLIAQLIFTNIYLGITEGALEEAVKYNQQNSRVWQKSLAKNIQEDPYTLLHYGECWSSLEAIRIQANHAASLLDSAWKKGLNLSDTERGEVALAIFSAKANITKAGLEITSRIFDMVGARATTAKLKLDRYWRNLRVYTLHDPVDYKFRDLGDWALNGNYPLPGFYS